MNESLPFLPIGLTIAGSDSGGGAGIQADIKTFTTLGVFGTSAITAITAQNPAGVTAIQGIKPEVVAGQIEAVMDYFTVGAIKIGMLFSTEIINAVADTLEKRMADGPEGNEGDALGKNPFIVVDPVMVATSGARLLNEDAVSTLCERILPLATVITPNTGEAAILAECKVENEKDQETAARIIQQKFGVAALVKGGHLSQSQQATDLLWDGKSLETFTAPFIRSVDTHGTGCTLSSAIAVFLMKGHTLVQAVAAGKDYLSQALSRSLFNGRGAALNHGFNPQPIQLLG